MDQENPSPKRARRLQQFHVQEAPKAPPEEAQTTRTGQVFLKHLQIEGFKTFCESRSIDLCPGWKPLPASGVSSPAPSPLTIIFGGNGAGKSSVFDAVFFVLGQSSKSIRSSGGSTQLVNDRSVLKNGAKATASVTITFQMGGECQDMDVDNGDDLSVEGASSSNIGSGVQELSVGRSVKHCRGTSTYSAQGKACSRAAMMQTLNDFVGADMGDVDRYVLKQGSTMVCRRDGKELLEFIERLAGTASMKAETEEVQTALDDLREEALGLENDARAFLHARKKLQSQVDAFFAYQKDVADLRREKIGLWRRKLALLRVRLAGLDSTAAKNETEDAKFRGTIKSAKARHEKAERDLALSTRASDKALKSQSTARGRLQETELAQAEAEALAKKNLKSARAKGKALTRALKLASEGEGEVAKLSAQASELDSTSTRTKARVVELEQAPEMSFSVGGGEGFQKRDELLRELGALEGGPLPELEKSVAERKHLCAQARQLLDRLVSDLAAARLELERRNGAVASSEGELEKLRERIAKVDAQSVELRARCASQQALVGSLEAAQRPRTRPGTATGLQPTSAAAAAAAGPPPPGTPRQEGRIGALRSLAERLREGGVGAHGLLADLVLLRRQRDEAAVTAVLGSALRDTVVVQTRADGARFVAEVGTAGIPGRVRCDVLDEIKGGGSTVSAAAGRRGGWEGLEKGLTPLSECVTTSDPRHLRAAEKRLRGWLLAENRQAAWAARSGSPRCGAANVVTASGELFYATGEVAVKAPHASTSSHTPRLVLRSAHQPGGGGGGSRARTPPRLQASAQQQQQRQGARESGGHKDVHDGASVEVQLEGAMASLSAAEARMAELAREATQARFEFEDAQVVTATAKTKAKECRREMSRVEAKMSAQRRLVVVGSGADNKLLGDGEADEAQLEKLRQRRDEIVAELAEGGNGDSEGAASEPGSKGGIARRTELLRRRNGAFLELRSLRAKADADRELRDEVGVKLRFLAKRGEARKGRVETLKAEKKDLETQLKSTKAGKQLREQKMADLLAVLEEAQSACRAKREAARAAEGAARKAKRELNACRAVRAELSKRQVALNAERGKARADSGRIMRSLSVLNAAVEAGAASPQRSGHGLVHQEEAGEDNDESASAAEAAEAAAAAKLASSLDTYLRAQSSDTGSNGDNNGTGPKSTGGDGGGGRRRRAARDGDDEEEDDFESDGKLLSKKRDAAAAAAAVATALPSGCGEEDEAKVAAFVRQLEAGGEEAEFLKDTGMAEASIRLKETNVKKQHEAFDAAAVARASRLDRDSVHLEHKLDETRESVMVLMDKKEVLEATRHATLVECLEEVNDALKGIYRRLTSVEDQGYTSGRFGVRGVPGGDCFLRFSRERTLLFREGLAVQVKPEASSPWRGPGALSGGQVALVGLALNLATQAVRPAPLYLMDEIDSALDTHKVRRVAMLLAARARSGNEQCIIISHRPEMHERGSHLIGVYHCEGTARTVGLELISQLPSERERVEAEDEGEDGRSQRRPP